MFKCRGMLPGSQKYQMGELYRKSTEVNISAKMFDFQRRLRICTTRFIYLFIILFKYFLGFYPNQ